ncbi:hypothetical protein D9619_005770 [Psilocybe cf. subviscida]|uniref:Uncharacterized protein n=1 Tax=Psilocybe cf. subviscida TaxID=2480587 RepID=A0A8H5BY62_9AGAR|nr:hypothetical protein D9619_005770 [Psilocybe cf. subviscida]
MSSRPEDAQVPRSEEQTTGAQSQSTNDQPPLVDLPELPTSELNLDFSSIIDPATPEGQKIQKRASNVMKLAEENEKLKAELKAMTDRLEAAERATAQRRREQMQMREQRIMEEPQS